ARHPASTDDATPHAATQSLHSPKNVAGRSHGPAYPLYAARSVRTLQNPPNSMPTLMIPAAAVFVFTLTLVIWRPRGLGIGWAAAAGAILALGLGIVHPSDIPV